MKNKQINKMEVNRNIGLLVFLFLSSCASNRQSRTEKVACKICCNSGEVLKNIVINKEYQGYLLELDSPKLRESGIRFSKCIDSFWRPSENEVMAFEKIIRRDSFLFKKMLPKEVKMSILSDYLRQYVGITDCDSVKLLLISFNFYPFLESYCENLEEEFGNNIVRMHFQKYGYDFLVIFNFATGKFEEFN